MVHGVLSARRANSCASTFPHFLRSPALRCLQTWGPHRDPRSVLLRPDSLQCTQCIWFRYFSSSSTHWPCAIQASFDDDFHWFAQSDDASRGDFCEPAPLLKGYWPSLIATIVIYAFGLQAWPLYLFSWFLSYYTWFSSVYYAQLFSHPFFYSSMIAIRGRIKLIWAATIIIVLLNYIVVAGWVIGAHNDRMSDRSQSGC